MSREKNPVEEILENLAEVAAGASGQVFTARLDDVLHALFADTGIPSEELKTDLLHRAERHRLDANGSS